MEAALSFYNGFNRAELLLPDGDFGHMDMNKVMADGDLVDEVEPAGET